MNRIVRKQDLMGFEVCDVDHVVHEIEYFCVFQVFKLEIQDISSFYIFINIYGNGSIMLIGKSEKSIKGIVETSLFLI